MFNIILHIKHLNSILFISISCLYKMFNDNRMVVIISFTIIFAILTSPMAYKFSGAKTNKYDWITSTDDGCPYAAGIALHSLLFLAITSSIVIDNPVIGFIMLCLISLSVIVS